MRHPFEDTPQYLQVYSNRHGIPLASSRNCVGRLPRRLPAEDESAPFLFDAATGAAVSESQIVHPEQAEPPAPDLIPEVILALELLTAKQRFVVELRYGLKGVAYSLDEVAALMGVGNQAVSRIEQRALRVLRRGLEELGVQGGGLLAENRL